jgi:protein O-mannosyl-transferase
METRFVVSVVAVILAGVVTWFFRHRAPGLVVALLAYAAFLGPVLGLFQNGPQIVADRYSYLPSIGLSILITGAIAAWWVDSPRRRLIGATAVTAILAAVAFLMTLTTRQCRVWRTTESLWTATLAGDPTSAIANNGLGVIVFREKGRPADAVPLFRKAVALDPASKGIRMNLRNALRESGQLDALTAAWADEAKYSQEHNAFTLFTAAFHANAGTTALHANENTIALEHLSASLAIDPKQPEVENNLALILGRLDRVDDAITHYRRAIELNPKLPNPHYGLASMLMRKGNYEEGIEAIQKYLELQPNEPNGLRILEQLRSLQTQYAPGSVGN